MLTRELLRYSCRAGSIKPQFIPEDDPRERELAAKFLSVFCGGTEEKMRRGELEELLEPLVRAERKNSPAAGFVKLLTDQSEFATQQERDYASYRRERFARAAEALRLCGGDRAQYARRLGADAGDLYGDLPENEELRSTPEWTPAELIARYNLSLVQSLLLYTEELEVSVPPVEASELRRLLRYLKFFRLLAEITRLPDGSIVLNISGPFALFANTRKYALQLASFFPAVVLLPRWKLRAGLKIGTKKLELSLTQAAPLHSHYRNFSRYMPEEITLFLRHFKEKGAGWRITGDTTPLTLPGGRIAFPDLSFVCENETATIIHLELFHRWHTTELARRLEWLSEHPELPLLLGIDRSICDDEAFAAMQAKYPLLAARLFRFRDFPGVDRVQKTLNDFLKGEKS